MSADNDPMPVLRTLLQRLTQEANAIGLDMGQAVIIPSLDGSSPDILQAVFSIRPAAIDTGDEQAKADEKAVEEMFARSQEAEVEEHNKTILDDVKGWLDE